MKNALLLLLFTLSATFLTLSAQDTQARKNAQPFALDTLVEATQITEKALADAKRMLNDSAQYFVILLRYEELQRSNPYALDNDSIYADYSNLPLSSFEETGRFWADYKISLKKIHVDDSVKITEMSRLVPQLTMLRDRWLASRTLNEENQITSGAIVESVDRYATGIASVNEKIKFLLDKYVRLDTRLTKHAKQVEIAVERFNEVIAAKAKSMFVKDAPPLFRALAADTLSLADVMHIGWRTESRAFKDFVTQRFVNIIWHCLFTITLMFLIFGLAKNTARNQARTTEELGERTSLEKHPLLIGLIIGLFSTGLFYKGLPIFYLNALIIIGLVPVSILLPEILKRRIVGLPAFLLVLIALSGLMALLRNNITYERLALFVTALITMGSLLFVVFRKRSRQAIIAQGGLIIFVIVVVYIALSGASIVFNLIGLSQLAVLMAIGVVYSFFSGLIAFVSVKMSQAVLGTLVRSVVAQRLNLIRNNSHGIEVWIGYITALLGVLFWMRSVLASFKILSTIQSWYLDAVAFSYQFGEVSLSLQNIFDFVIILFIFYVIANLTNLIIQDEVLPRYDLRAGFPLGIAILARYIILFLGFVLAMSAAGISLSKLNLIIGALGVGIGFGLQGIVSNFVSGFVIIFERPIHLGDIVSTGVVEGEVTSIGLRSTHIRTYDGAEVIVPNNSLISSELTNFSYDSSNRRVERFVYIEGGNNPRHVKLLIDSVLSGHEGLVTDDTSTAYFLGYENNALKFRVLMWMKEGFLQTPSEVLMNIHEALSTNGYKPYIPVQKVVLQKDEASAGRIIGSSPMNVDSPDDANR